MDHATFSGLVDAFYSNGPHGAAGDPYGRPLLIAIRETIQDALTSLASADLISEEERRILHFHIEYWELQGVVTHFSGNLKPDIITELRSRLSSDQLLSIEFLAFARAFLEVPLPPLNEAIEERIQQEIADIARLRQQLEPRTRDPRSPDSQLLDLLNRATGQIKTSDEMLKRVAMIEAQAQARAEREYVELATLRAEISHMKTELEGLAREPDDIREKIKTYGSEATSTLEAFRLEIGLDQTRTLWKDQAAQGRRAYYISLALLLSAFVTSAIIIWLYSADLISFLGEIEAFAVADNVPAPVVYVLAIGRLLLITGPIALLVWAAKLIVRFNVRSMLLMDDASHRVTMLDTYLFLVTKEAATLQDRGALLEAMFRRAPGHGPETVEPPNLTDIMRYGEVVGGQQKG
jgi:hypothetical protein